VQKFRNFIWNFIGEPLKRKNKALFFYRATQFLHEKTNGRSSILIRLLAPYFKPPINMPSSSWISKDEVSNVAAQINELGWAIPKYVLSQRDVREFREFAFSTPCYVQSCTEAPILLHENALPSMAARYTWCTRDVVKVGAIQRLVADPGLHEIAQAYLKCRPLLTNITMWLTAPYQGHYDAHNYHYDIDNPKFIKFFIYLTDVAEDTGAHYFMQRSHNPQKPYGCSKSIRYADEKIYSVFGRENEILFAAPAGTIIAEDTMGFHKGSTPKRYMRLLLQLEYSILDAPGEELDCPIHPQPIKDLDADIARIARKFFIRE
jgi:hypothetical protein